MKTILLSVFSLLLSLSLSGQRIDGLTDSLPENIRPDYEHAPFYHGVASFDPSSNQIILWTKITPMDENKQEPLFWELAQDSLFNTIVREGKTLVGKETNFTFSLDVAGLTSNSKYFYRFRNKDNKYSAVGETQTAPEGQLSKLRVGVTSCTSIYSGFFGAYRNMAKQNELFCIIHLGDYIYDFVDENEQVRIPKPYPQEPKNLNEYRQRHAYYLLDPDLRYARQHKPFVANWDNHDIDNRPKSGLKDQGIQAFQEYCPWRRQVDTSSNIIYRQFQWGNLVDYCVTDQRLWRYKDTLTGGETNLLGKDQFGWICKSLKNSKAKWKLIGSQKMFGGWYTKGIPPGLLQVIPNDGNVFDDGGWDGYPTTRNMLLDSITAWHLDNCVFISGDAHMSFAMDLCKNPQNPLLYDPETGKGSLGVEFLPASISRGNFDEQGVPESIANLFISINKKANPHHYLNDFTRHGYGMLTFTEDSLVAQIFYCKKETLDYGYESVNSLVVKTKENHWSRTYKPIEPSLIKSTKVKNWKIYPNPSKGGIVYISHPIPIEVTDKSGKLVYKNEYTHEFYTKDLPKGKYIIKNINSGKKKKLIIK